MYFLFYLIVFIKTQSVEDYYFNNEKQDIVFQTHMPFLPQSLVMDNNVLPIHLGDIKSKVDDSKAPFSIATTRGRCFSFPWIAPLYPWYIPYNAECEVRQYQVPFFGITWSGIKPPNLQGKHCLLMKPFFLSPTMFFICIFFFSFKFFFNLIYFYKLVELITSYLFIFLFFLDKAIFFNC